MPVSYEIASRSGVVRLAVTGVVSPAELLDCLSALAADPAHRRGMPQLVDLRGVEGSAPVADLDRVAIGLEQLRPQFAGARCAVIIASAAVLGAVRQFGALAARSGLEVVPFIDADRAHAWLGVDRDADSGHGKTAR